MNGALHTIGLLPKSGKAGVSVPGLVPVSASEKLVRVDEQAALLQALGIGDIDYIFFRRFSDQRSSQVAAYVIDNSDERFNHEQLAEIHKKLWLNGSAPLLYVGWETRVDILSCARGPDFWQDTGTSRYQPAEQIEVAAQVSSALLQKQQRFSAFRLSDGSFWDNPENSHFADAEKAAHRRLINAVVETDQELDGKANPLLRRLLLLTVLIKYLDDRGVFPANWFAQFHRGATTFFDILQQGSPDELRELLGRLERKFNGDAFALPEDVQQLTTKSLRSFADLVEAKTLRSQRYLWEQFSFRYLPVEVLSHLYQRFAQSGVGAVFTPPFVAGLMLDYAMPYASLTGHERILDPTCGSGVFLVGAFRKLVHFWRSKNHWKQPDVPTLKAILKKSIFGVELQEEAAHLTIFNLALAICDALQPNVIWKDLRFEKLLGSNILTGDLFSHLQKLAPATGSPEEGFDIILGNPPFMSKFSEAANQINKISTEGRVRVPDNQMAYLIAEQAMPLLRNKGHLCLLQPSGFLYNEKAKPFQKAFLSRYKLEAILDFTSIRKLYDGADPKTLALLARKQKPESSHSIYHLTFRRTFSVQERIGFELDHYDRHATRQESAQLNSWIWRVNLVGGGRLYQLADRLHQMPTLQDFISEKGWNAGEGFIVGEGEQRPAPWLTGKRLLPTNALLETGIDHQQLSKVSETLFTAPRTPVRYEPPLVLIKEHESLPCAFWNSGSLGYKHKIVGIHADPKDERKLRDFYNEFLNHRQVLRAFCILFGTQALVGKATAILKRDIEVLPWPKGGAKWNLSRWEQILCEDVVQYMAEYVRLGQNSPLLKTKVTQAHLDDYADIFTELLGSVYSNLRSSGSLIADGISFQAFCFGNSPEIDLPKDITDSLSKLIYIQNGEALRTVRVLRFYDKNVILIIKPDRLRYWIRSTAIRDADETLTDLRSQGF